jgi:hypothetical protein
MSDIALAELEIRYSHLEKLVNELSEVIYKQQKEIDALKEGYVKIKLGWSMPRGMICRRIIN